MASAAMRKSLTDLTRRKARSVFALLTLAIAVASVGIFAAPSLMDRAMQKEVSTNKLPDLTLSTEPLPLTAAQVAAVGRLPNVDAAQAVSYFQTRVWLGARRDTRSSSASPTSPTSLSTSSPSLTDLRPRWAMCCPTRRTRSKAG